MREGQRVPPPPADAAQREREEKTFQARAEKIAELTPADLDAVTVGSDVVFRDALIPLYREKRIGRVMLRYAVTATRDKKRVSDLSGIVSIVPRVPPDRPLRVVATVEENRVCLDWLAARGDAGRHDAAGRRGLRDLPARGVRGGVRRQAPRRRDRRDHVRRRDRPPGPILRVHRARGARRGGPAHPRAGRRTRSPSRRRTSSRLRRPRGSSSSASRAGRASSGTRRSPRTSPSTGSTGWTAARGRGSRTA